MKQVQRGFTLIELVMVIVILGVLAAVAIPKFVDLKGDAQVAVAQGVAGSGASASAINYAQNQIKGTTLLDCAGIADQIQGMPADITITASTPTTTCSVTGTGTNKATASFILTRGV